MKTVTIYGASDDLIEVEGDIREEFSAYDPDGLHVAVSDGTLISVDYTDAGFWRLHVVRRGSCTHTKTEGADVDGDYSDRITLTGDIHWLALTSKVVKAPAEVAATVEEAERG